VAIAIGRPLGRSARERTPFRRQIERRAADGLKHIGRRRLLFRYLVQFTGEHTLAFGSGRYLRSFLASLSSGQNPWGNDNAKLSTPSAQIAAIAAIAAVRITETGSGTGTLVNLGAYP
jgi:hypothetical protein